MARPNRDILKQPEESSGERARAIEGLCEHLRRIGLNATVESKECNFWEKFDLLRSFPKRIIGSVRVVNRNIDLVELEWWVEVWGKASFESVYRCNYVVRAKVDGLEYKLKAEGKPVRKGFLSREIVDFKWEGTELAQVLNSDSDLKHYFLSQHRPPIVEINPCREHQCVRIRQKRGTRSPASEVFPLSEPITTAFPTVETFEAVDRIAQHVHRIANVSP